MPKKQQLPANQSQHFKGGEVEINNILQKAIEKELDNDANVDFANKIDSDYEKALSKLVGWSKVSTPLIPDCHVSWYYYEFKALFPLTGGGPENVDNLWGKW